MRYVDGFVLPVPKKSVETYRRMARTAGKVWRDHGALEYMECVADDVKPGKQTSFPQSVKLKPGETWRQESITGSVFEGTVREVAGELIPTIKGNAFVNAESKLILNSADPYCWGITPA